MYQRSRKKFCQSLTKIFKDLNPDIKSVKKDFESQIKDEISAENEYKFNMEVESNIRKLTQKI